MTYEALKVIVLHELGLVEEQLSDEQRIRVAIDIALRLLSVELEQA